MRAGDGGDVVSEGLAGGQLEVRRRERGRRRSRGRRSSPGRERDSEADRRGGKQTPPSSSAVPLLRLPCGRR